MTKYRSSDDQMLAIEVVVLTQILAEPNVYDLQGRSLQNLQQGMNIIRCSDGTVKKVFVKR